MSSEAGNDRAAFCELTPRPAAASTSAPRRKNVPIRLPSPRHRCGTSLGCGRAFKLQSWSSTYLALRALIQTVVFWAVGTARANCSRGGRRCDKLWTNNGALRLPRCASQPSMLTLSPFFVVSMLTFGSVPRVGSPERPLWRAVVAGGL